MTIVERLQKGISTGSCAIGQIWIERHAAGFTLCHAADRGSESVLEVYQGAEAARHISNLDDAGAFRPLKTAPNLRRGWLLHVADLAALRRALDYFYPAMLGVAHSHALGKLQPVSLRETLSRQTGMYAITKKISDADADVMVGRTCQSATGCLKHILWPISPEHPISSLPAEKLSAPAHRQDSIPLLCHEACNLLVAETRRVVKAAWAQQQAALAAAASAEAPSTPPAEGAHSVANPAA